MEVLIILGHPVPGSLNHALAGACADEAARLGHRVTLHDLHAEGFDPALPGPEMARGAELPPLVAAHCADLARADVIVIVHPNWWGMPPAMLKGWVDRVVRPGVAYEFLEGDGGEGVPRGLLKARAAVVLNTGNTPLERERDAFGDPLERLWRDCIFGLCGVGRFYRKLFSVVVTADGRKRRAWLDQARDIMAQALTN